MIQNINILSESEARQWQRDINALNEETKRLLEATGETLKQVKDDADSSFVDEIFDWGTKIVNGATKVFEGMNELYTAVDSILGKLTEVLENSSGIVKGIVGAIKTVL